jgi:hypothetical protein
MLAVLQSYGTFFNSNDFSKINFRYGAILSAASRSILHEIVSGPLALLIIGVATLEVDGCYMEDNKSKAEALSKQFQSVFTGEDMSTLPQMGTSKTQDISSIQIQEKGILCDVISDVKDICYVFFVFTFDRLFDGPPRSFKFCPVFWFARCFSFVILSLFGSRKYTKNQGAT